MARSPVETNSFHLCYHTIAVWQKGDIRKLEALKKLDPDAAKKAGVP
jgi:hypothetical protein